MSLGFDGASAFDLTAAKKAGGILATVYIVGQPGGMPHADAARVAAIRAAGMGALPNWERAADFFSTCSLADAKAAGVEARQACIADGFPAGEGIAVPFSFDCDIPASRYPEMAAKLAACNSGLGGDFRAIAYAEWGLLQYLAAHGQPGPHWLMMSTFNEHYDPSAPFVGMVQQHVPDGNGGWTWQDSPVSGTDLNYVTRPEAIGAWWPDNSPYGGDMPLTDADVARVADAVWAKLRPVFTDDKGAQYRVETLVGEALAKVLNPSALAAAIAKQLPDIQPAQVQSAVEAGVRQVLGSLDNAPQ